MDANTSDNVAAPAASRRGVIDQFEGDLAVIMFEGDEQLVVPRSTLPPNARAGDVVTISVPAPKAGTASAQAESAAPAIEVDAAATAASKERIRNLLDDIFKK
ncbi:MAG: DUF3006 domain-containing protein [Chloroflexi bacterium]|nr:DUF3006 domain-containing protein [Chloroflexota bacterium]